ncbi:MAG: dihydropteroate synthase [Desulfovibrionaceae bacterium]|nr:dihydropteroate synthase [Desulfovibrionaceae bacterium]
MNSASEAWHHAGGPVPHAPGRAGIMGIVNITQDSFYAASRAGSTDDAVRRALALLADGADVIDLGAESSRPGSSPVSPEDELQRLLPVIDALKSLDNAPVLSVDTYHAATAAAVLEHGADIINDISACSFDPGLADVLAQYRPGYVLMHCQGTPGTMQVSPHYDDVLSEVTAFFEEKMNMLVRAGLPEQRVILDPGIGFGKKMEHNLALMAHPEAWHRLGRPSLMALSMKSVFQDLLGLPVAERGQATQVATALTCAKGYSWHRVHDALATDRTLRLAAALSR